MNSLQTTIEGNTKVIFSPESSRFFVFTHKTVSHRFSHPDIIAFVMVCKLILLGEDKLGIRHIDLCMSF